MSARHRSSESPGIATEPRATAKSLKSMLARQVPLFTAGQLHLTTLVARGGSDDVARTGAPPTAGRRGCGCHPEPLVLPQVTSTTRPSPASLPSETGSRHR